MSRVLLAQSVNWISTARLPAMLSRAGLTCDLVDAGGSFTAASSHIRTRKAIPDDVDGIAREVLRVADDYDRVLVCNERLIRAVIRLGGKDARRVFGNERAGLRKMCDKTLFSPAAREGGLRVPEFEVVDSAHEAESAAGRLGGRVAVKGRWGEAGRSVRLVNSPAAAALAAEQLLGESVLVERIIEGDLVNTPCLFEKGRLVAALACRKVELVSENGPSARNEFIAVDERLRSACERMGEVFQITGFASADMFLVDDDEPVLLEINPRQVPQLHLGRSVGVDMGRALADVLAGRWDGTPRTSRTTRTVGLFPQSLTRSRSLHGRGAGTLRWAATRGALADVPWDDLGLLAHHIRELASPQA